MLHAFEQLGYLKDEKDGLHRILTSREKRNAESAYKSFVEISTEMKKYETEGVYYDKDREFSKFREIRTEQL